MGKVDLGSSGELKEVHVKNSPKSEVLHNYSVNHLSDVKTRVPMYITTFGMKILQMNRSQCSEGIMSPDFYRFQIS